MKIKYNCKEYELTTCMKAKEIVLHPEDGSCAFLQNCGKNTHCLIFEEVPAKPNAVVDWDIFHRLLDELSRGSTSGQIIARDILQYVKKV